MKPYANPSLVASIFAIRRQAEESLGPKKVETDRLTRLIRVPDWLRSTEKDRKPWYEPSHVSLGPLHRIDAVQIPANNARLRRCQDYKGLAACRVVVVNCDLDMCMTELRKLEDRARKFYNDLDPKDISSEEFIKMLFLDSCFIFASLVAIQDPFKRVWSDFDEDASPTNTQMVMEILDDLLLMENQIPLFVLMCVGKFINPTYKIIDPNPMFVHYRDDSDQWSFIIEQVFNATQFALDSNSLLDLYRHSYLHPSEEVSSYISICCHDLNDFCCCCCFPKSKTSMEKNKSLVVHSATSLKEKFVVFKAKSKFQEISFRNGTLNVPSIMIEDPKILSMVALEQFELRKGSPSEKASLSNVIQFIACMTKNKEDLKIFVDCGVIKTSGATEDCWNLLEKFRNNLMPVSKYGYFRDVCQDIDVFIDSRRCQWLKKLKNDYFSNPWTAVSLIAAAFLLILTSLQTFYTVFPYYHPSNN